MVWQRIKEKKKLSRCARTGLFACRPEGSAVNWTKRGSKVEKQTVCRWSSGDNLFWKGGLLTNHGAVRAGAQPRDRLCVQRVTLNHFVLHVRQYLTSLFILPSPVLSSGLLWEVQGWAPAQAGWDAQETPLGHFLFCIVAEKGRKLNRSSLSFLSSQPTGQFTSADMWKSHFVFIRFQTGLLTQTWLSHICRSGKSPFFFGLSPLFSLWPLLVGIRFPPSDRRRHIFVTVRAGWNTSARPFLLPPIQTHMGWKTSCPLTPHSQTEFCPGGGGARKRAGGGVGGREKEWGRKLQCGQKSAFSISWGGSGLDRGELQPAPHTKECYQAPFLTLTVRHD